MMRPPRGDWRFMIRNASCVQRKAPVRFVSITAAQFSRSRSSSGTAGAPTPALLNSRSSRPNLASISAKTDATDSASRMSQVSASGIVAHVRGRSLEWPAATADEDDGEAGLGQSDR